MSSCSAEIASDVAAFFCSAGVHRLSDRTCAGLLCQVVSEASRAVASVSAGGKAAIEFLGSFWVRGMSRADTVFAESVGGLSGAARNRDEHFRPEVPRPDNLKWFVRGMPVGDRAYRQGGEQPALLYW